MASTASALVLQGVLLLLEFAGLLCKSILKVFFRVKAPAGLSGQRRTTGSRPAPPRVIGIVIAEPDVADVSIRTVARLASWCFSYGSVQQVHLYDPAGHLKGCQKLLQDTMADVAAHEGHDVMLHSGWCGVHGCAAAVQTTQQLANGAGGVNSARTRTWAEWLAQNVTGTAKQLPATALGMPSQPTHPYQNHHHRLQQQSCKQQCHQQQSALVDAEVLQVSANGAVAAKVGLQQQQQQKQHDRLVEVPACKADGQGVQDQDLGSETSSLQPNKAVKQQELASTYHELDPPTHHRIAAAGQPGGSKGGLSSSRQVPLPAARMPRGPGHHAAAGHTSRHSSLCTSPGAAAGLPFGTANSSGTGSGSSRQVVVRLLSGEDAFAPVSGSILRRCLSAGCSSSLQPAATAGHRQLLCPSSSCSTCGSSAGVPQQLFPSGSSNAARGSSLGGNSSSICCSVEAFGPVSTAVVGSSQATCGSDDGSCRSINVQSSKSHSLSGSSAFGPATVQSAVATAVPTVPEALSNPTCVIEDSISNGATVDCSCDRLFLGVQQCTCPRGVLQGEKHSALDGANKKTVLQYVYDNTTAAAAVVAEALTTTTSITAKDIPSRAGSKARLAKQQRQQKQQKQQLWRSCSMLSEMAAAVGQQDLMCEPELLLVFGPVLTLAGYPPFHTRVAEIQHFGRLSAVQRSDLEAVLARYCLVLQRHGA